MQGLRDEEVMMEYQKGNLAAMGELVQRYKNPVFSFAYRFLGDREEAREIAQEVFLRLHIHKTSYRPTGKFSTWIFSIAHNLCVSVVRRRRRFVLWPRKSKDDDGYVDVADSNPSPDTRAEENDVQQTIKRCINELPFLQKEALVLREYQSMSYEDIAVTMKQPVNTVKSLIHRARINLKEKLLPLVHEAGRGQS